MSGLTAPIVPVTALGNEANAIARRSRPFSDVRPLTVFYTLLVMVCLYVFLQVLVTAGPTMFTFGLGMRYLLWPLILIGAATHIILRGISDILAPSAILMPLFVIGIVSALICVEPLEAAREVAFFLLLLLAATAAGRQLGERLTGQLLFWGFGSLILLSVVVSVALPKIGVVHDLRAEGGGAWRGVFGGKNWLGWYGGLTLLTALTVQGLHWRPRAAAAVLAIVCVYFAHSAGATVQTVMLIGFIGALQMTRRLNLSPALKGTLIGVTALFVLTVGVLFWDQMLTLLGRDATLTGRTVIWRLYLDRAMENWFLGAGPGSFTHWSLTTSDIGLSLQSLGLIQTPHNMYIAAFGEIGLLGLLAWLAPLFYFAFVQPFRHPGPMPLMLSGMTFSLLINGTGETHSVFGMGIATFIVIVIRASIGHGEGSERLAVATVVPEKVDVQSDPFKDGLYEPSHGPILLG